MHASKRQSAKQFRRINVKSSRQLGFESLEERIALAVVPTGFTDTEVISGGLFTTLQFDETGRGWVAFDDGRIGVFENDAWVNVSAYDLDAKTDSDQGLLGLELDRDFSTNGYIYVSYVDNDSSPNAKLSRLEVDLSTGNTFIPESETILLELPDFSEVGDPSFHIAGAIHHNSDGTLFMQVGDHEQRVSAQDVTSPLGKILRVNTDGSAAIDNPYYDASDGIDWTDYVWSLGVRNAFAGDVDPVTGRYFISDVGSSNWEEINDATQPGLNFGWPSAEGASGDLNYTDPFYAYTHGPDCAITAGTFYRSSTPQFPAEYEGRYFFADYCAGEIRSIDPDDPSDVQVFAFGINFPVNISIAPDGTMYYIALGNAAIHKVEYIVDSPPEIVLQPEDTLVSLGDEATFLLSVGGTSPFTYQWQEDSSGSFVDIPGANAQVLSLSSPTLADNGTQYRVVVNNAFGSVISDSATLSVTADTPPSAEILLASTTGSTYRAGDIISYSAIANDLEDGILPTSAYEWKIDFHHNVHTHPFAESITNVSEGNFEVPNTGETDPDVWFRVYLTVTDSIGLKTTVFEDIYPELTDFRIDSSLQSSEITIDGQGASNPTIKSGVEGVLRNIEVPESQSLPEGSAYFVQWLDGTITHQRTIVTPQEDQAYVALYGVGNSELETVFLSDLTPTGTPVNGWGPIELDTSNGGTSQGDGGPILLNGVTYSKGLGVHADSEVVYALNGEYSRFLSDIGLSGGPRPNGDVTFEVYGDGVLIGGSDGLMTGESATQSLDIDVTGVSELRLVVDGNGSIDFDSSTWANARLLRILPNTVYLSDLTPVGIPINGWGPIELDMSNGGTGQGDGGTLLLNGVEYEKGLGVHADSEVVYALNGEYTQFVSDIGINAGPRPTGSVTFEVYGDGVLLGGSDGVMTGESATQSLNIDVTGVDELRLVVLGGESIDFDSVNWADAKVIRSSLMTFPEIRGVEVVSGGQLVKLLPYSSANTNLDARLNLTDIDLFVSNWGTESSGADFSTWIQNGDYNFDGITNNFDWNILNQAWANLYGNFLIQSEFFDEETIFLSDMVPIGIPTNGLGPIEIDMSVGGEEQGDGETISINGATYEKGIGVFADSEIRYALNGLYDRFQVDVGLDAGPRLTGDVVFEVYGDGVLIGSSGQMTGESLALSLDIDVVGVEELRLVVDSNGSADFDSANWADAKLIGKAQKMRLDADFDGDEDVDGADILALFRGFGTENPEANKSDGDADYDYDVDQDDLMMAMQMFGMAADPESPAQAQFIEESVVIEEPVHETVVLPVVESSSEVAEFAEKYSVLGDPIEESIEPKTPPAHFHVAQSYLWSQRQTQQDQSALQQSQRIAKLVDKYYETEDAIMQTTGSLLEDQDSLRDMAKNSLIEQTESVQDQSIEEMFQFPQLLDRSRLQ